MDDYARYQNALRDALAKAKDSEKVVWVLNPLDTRMPGASWAYLATGKAVGRADPQGNWELFPTEDTSHEAGTAESASAGREIIEKQVRGAIVTNAAEPAMTDPQKIANYKRILLGRVRTGERRQAIAALVALDRAGWLESCPELDPQFGHYVPIALQVKLHRLGKLSAEV